MPEARGGGDRKCCLRRQVLNGRLGFEFARAGYRPWRTRTTGRLGGLRPVCQDRRKSLAIGLFYRRLRLGLRERLLLHLGKQGMRDLLAQFWLTLPPEMSAAAEAVQFGKFLLAKGPSIPLLKEITSFEMAAAYSVMTNEPQTVEIDCDIRLAIDALVEGRRPEPPGPTPFKFIIDPPSRCSVLSDDT